MHHYDISKYRSICRTYGTKPMRTIMYGSALSFFGGLGLSESHSAIGNSLAFCGFGTLMGLGVAVLGHESFSTYLAIHNIPARQGSRLLRRFQFTSVALGLCAGAAVSSLAVIHTNSVLPNHSTSMHYKLG